MTQLSERRITNGDFKRIYLPIGEWELEPPSQGIYEEPVVYYKANIKWAALIEGFVSWLTEITAWKNAEDENYSGIQSIMTFLERIVIEIDCAQVEDCLETSVIINQMITNITNNTNNITTNTTNITNIENNITNINNELEIIQDDAAIDGVDLPPNTEITEDDTKLCKAANYIATRIIDEMVDMWADAATYNLLDFVQLMLGQVFYDYSGVQEFWQYAFTISDPTLATDAATYKPNLIQAIYCSNFTRAQIIQALSDDSAIPTNEQTLLIKMVANLRQSQLNEWAFIGALDTASYTCFDCEGSWDWAWIATACDYFLPSGWTLNITEGVCGDGTGAFNGIWDTTPSAPARVIIIVSFPSQFVENIRVEGFINGFHASNAGTVNVAATGFSETQALAQNPSVSHLNFNVNAIISSFTVTATHSTSTQSPRGVVVNRLAVNVSP